MSREPSPSASSSLRALLESGTTTGLSDDQLLRRYVDRRSEADSAFEALIDRHGPMVWGVCRRALGRSPEAEDAFQATFLVLARRAEAVKVDGSLGRWLHGVASKVAIKARSLQQRRRAREVASDAVEPTVPAPDAERMELLAALDEELARLPEKYRSPLILCHLEGFSYAESAERLGCPTGAIKGRLTRGRELLRSRLARRGLGLPESAPEGSPIPDSRPAVPPLLIGSIVRAASPSLTVAGASTTALTLAKGVLRTMSLTRWSRLLILLAPASALVVLRSEATTSPATPEPKGPPPAVAVDEPREGRAIVVPLPSKDDLRALLRQAAEGACLIALKDPQPSAGSLATIAQAQATAGDLEGSRTTFAVAVRAAGGDLGGAPIARNLLTIGQAQAEAGLRGEAGATFRRALETVPGFARDIQRDWGTLQTLVDLVKEQAGIGERDEARRTADRLEAFVAELFARTETMNAPDAFASDIAGALAAVDDFAGAFARVKTTTHGDWVAGEAALSAAKYLDKDRARRYITEATAQMVGIKPTFGNEKGLSLLAEAQARIGDFEAAKATARSIAFGPPKVDEIGPDAWASAIQAMKKIADVQREAGQREGARETLLEGYRMGVDHPTKEPWGRFLGIAAAQVEAGDLEGALRSAESSPEKIRATTLAKIARAQALAGRGEEARKTSDRALAEAQAITRTLSKPNPEIPPSAKLKTPPAKTGVSLSSINFQVFSGTDPKPMKARPAPPGLVAIWDVVEIQATAGDVSEALRNLRTLDEADDRRFVLKRIVVARAATGDVKGALALATREARTDDERRLALEGLADGVEIRLNLEPR